MRERISASPRRLALFVTLVAFAALTLTGSAVANDEDGTPSERLAEVTVPNRAALDDLVGAGFDLAETVRYNDDGTLTVLVYGTDDEFADIVGRGNTVGATLEDENTWRARMAERQDAIDAANRAAEAAQFGTSSSASGKAGLRSLAAATEVTVQRVDYYESYAGRFLSVEAFDAATNGIGTSGPTLALSWKPDGGVYGAASTMSRNIDPDPTPDVYLNHRITLRISGLGSSAPPPAFVRIATSTPGVDPVEAPVNVWNGADLPPFAATFQSHFFDHYMDPTEGKARIQALAAAYPNIAELVDTPAPTNGYRRKAMGTFFKSSGTTDGAISGTPPAAATSQAVVFFSDAWDDNAIQAEFLNPGAANSPLSVAVAGKRITVNLATNGTGALASTAAQVRDALNADPAASGLVDAFTWAGNAGAGTVQPHALVNLSDFLNAPASVARAPFQIQALRIGKHRDGSKVGVFVYCEEHAREWVTPLVCLETANRLVANYGTDPLTTELVDNLDIFIIPTINPDGSHYSFYDTGGQRKNMTNYCPVTGTSGMPPTRSSWGVDNNRNFSVGSLFDGYFGASTNCTGETFAGPSELSEPENQSEISIPARFPNIKFSMNVHSSGGLFMWSPAAYTGNGRVALPYPNIGIEGYFWETAARVLDRIKQYRGNVIDPQTTGPVADVLYSAAGNSSDEMYYKFNLISYDFEVGNTRLATTANGVANTTLQGATAVGATDVRVSSLTNLVVGNTVAVDTGANLEIRKITALNPAAVNPAPNVTLNSALSKAHANGASFQMFSAEAGATGIRVASTAGLAVGSQIVIDSRHPSPQDVIAPVAETRTIATVTAAASPAPNVTFTEPLTFAHPAGIEVVGGTATMGSGFMPNYTTEGQHEAMEFANGNYGILERALAYSRDSEPPVADTIPLGPAASQTPIDVTFKWVNESSIIYYTLDGSTPTLASPSWQAQRPRAPGEFFTFDHTTTVKWFAVDVKGNTSAVRSARFAVETDAPTTQANLSPGAVGGYYRNPTVSLLADDDFDGGGAGIARTEYKLDGAADWTTYTAPFQVTGDGSHTLVFRSVDLAGNVEADQMVTFNVDATPPVITITTPLNNAQYLLNSAVNANFGCVDALAGLFTCVGTVANGGALDTTSVGFHNFTVSASDVAGNSTTKSVQYNVYWQFSGFLSPLGNRNSARAGSTIPVKFTLGGDRGMGILAPGYPTSVPTSCTAPSSRAAQAKKFKKARWAKGRKVRLLRPGTFSGLSFSPGNGQYHFNWTTEAEWSGTCRLLVVGFTDNTVYTAFFDFR